MSAPGGFKAKLGDIAWDLATAPRLEASDHPTRSTEGRQIVDADIDALRNVCRSGTYPRIREAIVEAAAGM